MIRRQAKARLDRGTHAIQLTLPFCLYNIAIIHGLEQSGGVHALVMELVEGDDL